MTEQLLADKMISKRDLKLFHVTDDVDEVVEIIRRHYNRRRRSKRSADGRETP
jgi:predicted Rossmann-fold nucleotide-binding protein